MPDYSYDSRHTERPKPISAYTEKELAQLTWADPTNADEVEADLAGWWMDPAGGMHPPFDEDDDYDPAAMYK